MSILKADFDKARAKLDVLHKQVLELEAASAAGATKIAALQRRLQ